MSELPTWLTAWLGWIELHPGWSLLLLAIASGVEGLFVIGIFIPGSVLMFAAGVLAANNILNPIATLVCAGFGAAIGDACSFAIGRAYRRDLPRLTGKWQVLPRAEAFFLRRGGISIILGRMIGPLRPFVPAVAGAAGYPWVHYIPMAIIASTLWVLAYALPGMVVGATLQVLSEILGRLSLLAGALALVLFIIYRVLAALLTWGQLYAEPTLLRMIDWSHRHRRLGRLGPALADRDQPETPVLVVSLLGLVLLGSIIELALRAYGGSTGIAGWNLTLLDQFAGFRSPLIDGIARALRWLTEPFMVVAMTVAGTLSYLVGGQRREGGHLIAGVIGAALLFFLLDQVVTQPPEMLPHHEASIGAITELGTGASLSFILAGLLATQKRRGLRMAVYWGLTALTSVAAISALILGEVLPDRGLALLAIAGLWASLITLGFRRHQHRPKAVPWLPLAIALSACLVLVPPPAPPPLSAPPNPDLLRSRPDRLNLYWQGEPAAALRDNGWELVENWDWTYLPTWFSDQPLSELDAAPVLLNGHRPDQVWRRGREILRLWQQQADSDRPDIPLWIGHYGHLKQITLFGLLRLPLTELAHWRHDSPAATGLTGIPQRYLRKQDLLFINTSNSADSKEQ